jgi:hypothetical protein
LDLKGYNIQVSSLPGRLYREINNYETIINNMKTKFLRMVILLCAIFLANAEVKAATEFTWVNNTGCALTITFYDASNTVLYSSSTSGGAAVCISGVSYIEISDACGGVWRYNACGVLQAGYPIGTPCACTWNANWGGSCGPAGPTCGPGSTLTTLNIT